MKNSTIQTFALSLVTPILLCSWARGQTPPAYADGYSNPCVLVAQGGCSPGSECYLAPVHAILLPTGDIMLAGLVYAEAEQLASTAPHWAYGGWTAIMTPPSTDPLGPPGVGNPPHNLELTLTSPPYEFPGEVCTLHESSEVDPSSSEPSYEVRDSLFCGGHTLTRNGDVFFAGGTREMLSASGTGDYRAGLPYAAIYDLSMGAWMSNLAWFVGLGEYGCSIRVSCPSSPLSPYEFVSGPERWYPTATRRDDGKILVTGVTQVVTDDGTPVVGEGKCSSSTCSACVETWNLSVEEYTPRSGTSSLVSASAATPPDVFSAEYPHVWQLPTDATQAGTQYDMLMMGETAIPVFMEDSTGTATWHTSVNQRSSAELAMSSAPNDGCGSLMLPFLQGAPYPHGTVMSIGGDGGLTSFERELAVYDPYADDWILEKLMEAGRHKPSPVILPTGDVLLLAGYDAAWGPDSLHAEYFDPLDLDDETPNRLGAAAMERARGYHTVSLLLPDGRVFLGGGRRVFQGLSYVEKADFQYYYPPYCYSQSRPSINTAPSTIKYDNSFVVDWTGQFPGRLALNALGAFTHSFDQSQRYIELEVLSETILYEVGGGQTNRTVVKAPPTSRIAPPGYYMLWVIDAGGLEDGVCEYASIVKLGS